MTKIEVIYTPSEQSISVWGYPKNSLGQTIVEIIEANNRLTELMNSNLWDYLANEEDIKALEEDDD